MERGNVEVKGGCCGGSCGGKCGGDKAFDASVLNEAAGLVEGARQNSYGHPLDNHGCTAALWSAWLSRRLGMPVRLTAEDVPWLNVLQKASREANQVNRDNVVDVIGYMANVEMIDTERRRRAGEGL